MTALWLLAVLAPLFIALAISLAGLMRSLGVAERSSRRRVLTRLAPLAPLPAGALALAAPDASRVEAPWLLLGTVVELDAVGRPLLLMTSLLYSVALAFVPRSGIDRPAMLSGLLLLCFVGNAGVFVAVTLPQTHLQSILARTWSAACRSDSTLNREGPEHGHTGHVPVYPGHIDPELTEGADAQTVAAGAGKSSTHPTQRHTPGPSHPRAGHTIRINDPRSTGC
jgi:hypothetical protein